MSLPPLGATSRADGSCLFNVWAPRARDVAVELVDSGRRVPLEPAERGYFRAAVSDVPVGARYFYLLSGDTRRPDPASRFQPDGVHGPSAVASLDFEWTDGSFASRPLREHVVYELHVGTYSRSGTFAGVAEDLERLVSLGVTTIELMPVAAFPGTRNWGYDGVYPFAAQSSYGGPRGLLGLVDACHARGLSVILDVVYNHLGPEGNYLGDFAPYFTDRHRTPWGSAINLDGEGSDEVRRYFIENALSWLGDFHLDGLRLDAVHEIHDRRALPFLEELAQSVAVLSRERGRPLYLIAECDTAEPRLVKTRELGGLGLSGAWCDDFHHAAHALLTGERNGYYVDFGRLEDLASAWRRGVSRPGLYSRHRGASHGRSDAVITGGQATICVQNHDQVGNRLLGERLGHLVGFEAQKLAAGLLMLAPHVPLLFMGQEYDEPAPFQYFVDHGDEALVEAVREGRKREFASFGHAGQAPDPKAEDVFERCRLTPSCRERGRHALLFDFYRELARLRREHPPRQADRVRTDEGAGVMLVERNAELLVVFHLGSEPRQWSPGSLQGRFRRVWGSADERWRLWDPSDRPTRGASDAPRGALVELGPSTHLEPHSFTLYARET